jgi:uncharacterized protein YndB with AHSA1/START domain
MTIARRLSLFLLLLATAATAHAEVKGAGGDNFFLLYSKRFDAPPATVYAALGKIDQWWDNEHTYSGRAANFTMELRAGSCFCEGWSGGSVEHGRVVMAIPGQILRIQTALGPLQGRAVTGMLTFVLRPEGTGTELTLSYLVIGASNSGLDKSAPPVDEVLGAQFARLGRLIETGKADAK